MYVLFIIVIIARRLHGTVSAELAIVKANLLNEMSQMAIDRDSASEKERMRANSETAQSENLRLGDSCNWFFRYVLHTIKKCANRERKNKFRVKIGETWAGSGAAGNFISSPLEQGAHIQQTFRAPAKQSSNGKKSKILMNMIHSAIGRLSIHVGVNFIRHISFTG